MKINNKKINIKVCNTFFSRLRGLMFSKRKNLLFKFKKEDYHPIHMFFVFYPIKVVWINKNKVVDVKLAYPFTPLLIPKQKAKYILELNPNIKIKINDKIGL